MALRHGTPVSHMPSGVCDAVDGTNAPAGAMAALENLIPDPSTRGVFVPRPAATLSIDFTTGTFNTPRFQSSELVVGDLVYGTIATARNAGKDEPFCYNLATGAFVTVSGIEAFGANVPTSPASSGDWTPPIIARVSGRIVVTHAGFPGGATKFGWFDVSGFTETTTGNTNSSTTIDGNPTILGVQPGMTVAGAGISAGTVVVSTAEFVLTTTGNTHTNTTLDTLASTTGVAVGQIVAGLGIPAGTTVSAIVGPTEVTLSQAATATAAITVGFAGATVTLNQAASATASGVALTIAGGTLAAPLWGAGDTDRNNLVAVPISVGQFNGRAYYAVAGGLAFSDSGFPCRMSTSVQILLTNDGLAVTALGALLLSAPLTGGIVQALIAFQGSVKMQQITGDASTLNLAMNALPVATGTDAPLSIAPCSFGLGFVSPQGLRFIKFDGSVTDPIGEGGTGITVPFIDAAVPSRIAAAANNDTFRITTLNGAKDGNPAEEYWYDLTRKLWSGPHASAASLIQPWRSTFLLTLVGVNAMAWKSDVHPSSASVYRENGADLATVGTTPLLPDTGAMAMNAIIQANLACQLANERPLTVTVTDERDNVLDTITLLPPGTFDEAVDGEAVFGPGYFGQRALHWHEPLVFKQCRFSFSASAGPSARLGNLYMKYQRLGYSLEDVA